MDALNTRQKKSFALPEVLALAVYSSVLAVAVTKHEPWLDEAQAWMLARDCSLPQIFFHRLHYEGTPGLWQLFLWFLVKAHASYAGMHWVTAGLAVASIYVLLRYSPFPLLFRVLLPFTFFLQYQFAIVARSYTFFMLGLLLLAALFRDRSRPLVFAAIAGLLANTSIFGAFAACGFIVNYFFPNWHRRRTALNLKEVKTALPKGPALTLFSALLLFAIYTALPAPENSYSPLNNLHGVPRHLLTTITFADFDAPPPPSLPEQAPTPPSAPNIAKHTSGSLQDRLWRLIPSQTTVVGKNLRKARLAYRLYVALCLITFPVADQNWLALLFDTSLLYWLFRRRQLNLLVPVAAIFLAFAIFFPAPHHIGLIWLTLLTTIWTALDAPATNSQRWAEPAFFLTFFLVIVGQISWTAHTLRNDYHGAYDASWMAANYIRSLPPGETIDAFSVHTVAMQPYFPRNIYSNWTVSYWPWSITKDPGAHLKQALETHPSLVIVSTVNTGDQIIVNQGFNIKVAGARETSDADQAVLTENGYSLSHKFCGDTFIRSGSEARICYLFFAPTAMPHP